MFNSVQSYEEVKLIDVSLDTDHGLKNVQFSECKVIVRHCRRLGWYNVVHCLVKLVNRHSTGSRACVFLASFSAAKRLISLRHTAHCSLKKHLVDGLAIKKTQVYAHTKVLQVKNIPFG